MMIINSNSGIQVDSIFILSGTFGYNPMTPIKYFNRYNPFDKIPFSEIKRKLL